MSNQKIYFIILFAVLFSSLSFYLDDMTLEFVDSIKNPFFDAIFSWFSNFTNIFVILIIVTTLFLWQEKKREWIFPLWLSYTISILVSFILKFLIARPRPIQEIFYPFINTISYSFPSMHTIAAFSTLAILIKEFPNIKWFWIISVSLVGLSRVYFEFHYLSDVITGAFLGYLIGVIVIKLEEKYQPFKFLK